MCTGLPGIVFLLVLMSDNLRMTYAQVGAPCKKIGSDYRCQGLFLCEDKPGGPQCHCPEEKPVWIKGEACRKGRPNEACNDPMQCESDMCSDGKCQCPRNTPYYDDDLKECRANPRSKIGGPCDSTDDCMPGNFLTCSEYKCMCEAGYYLFGADTCKKKETFGGKCETENECDDRKSLLCKNQTCDCPVDFVWKPKGCKQKVSFGEKCAMNDECNERQRLICQKKKCACILGLDWKPKGCEKAAPRTFGGNCSRNDHCITLRQLVCIRKKCKCKTGFVWAEGICKLKENQKKCNPFAEPRDCQDGLMECDVKDLVCQCPVGHEFSIVTKACKLKAGENCFINETLQHDLCASQQCNTKEGSDEKICACPENNGVTETWSSEPGQGCLTEYLDLPCAGSSDECRAGTFNTSRQGLICKNHICQCAEGLNYKRGYCVVANRLFDEPCDPDGINGTCRGDVETSLTCRDIGGGDMRCVCLLREMTVHGRKETVALTWNADQKKCDLKPNGARCNGNYECRIGHCRETCQKGISERAGKISAEAKLTNHKIPTVFTLIFIIFKLNCLN